MIREKENKAIQVGQMVQFKLEINNFYSKIWITDPIQFYKKNNTEVPSIYGHGLLSQAFSKILNHNNFMNNERKNCFLVLERHEHDFGKKIGKTMLSNKKVFLKLGFFDSGRMFEFWAEEKIFELFESKTYLESILKKFKNKTKE